MKKQLYKVSWRNKRTGEAFMEDFVEAEDFEGAIRETKQRIASCENGVAVADIQITDCCERCSL